MEKEQALRLWEMLYGDRDIAYDYASHPMYKNDFRNSESDGGWDVDYKQPLSKNGNTSMYNFIPTSILTKALRNERTVFKIGNFLYEVRKGTQYGSFHIFDVTDRSRPVDMEPNNQNQDSTYNQERLQKSLARKEEKNIDYAKDLYAFRNHSVDFGINTPIQEKTPIPDEQIEKLKEISAEATIEANGEVYEGKNLNSENVNENIANPQTSEIENLKKQITDLKIELSDKEHDIAELNDRLLALDNKVEEKEQSGDLPQEMTREEEISEIVINDEENERLKEENERLKNDIAEKEKEVERINTTLYSTVNKLNQLQETQSLIENENGNLKGKIAAFEDDKKTLESYKIIAEQKGIEINSLKKEITLSNDKLKQIEDERNETSKKICELESQKAELENGSKNKQYQIDELTAQLQKYKEVEASLNSRVQELLNSLEQLKKDNVELNEYKNEILQKETDSQKRFLDINAQKAELENQIQNIYLEKADVEKRLEILAEEKAQNASTLEELKRKIVELENINAQKDEELNKIKNEKLEADDKLNEQLEINSSENEKYQKIADELNDLKNRFQETAPLKAKIADLNSAIDLVNRDVLSKENKINQLLKEEAELNKTIEELKLKKITDEKNLDQIVEQKKESDANLLEYQNQIEDLSKVNNEKENVINELQLKITSLNVENDRLKQENEDLIRIKQLSADDKEKLDIALAEVQKSNDDLKSKYIDLNNSFNDAQSKYSTSIAEKEELSKRIEELQQDNIALQNYKQNLYDELNRNKEYLSLAEEQISLDRYSEVKSWLDENGLSFCQKDLKEYLQEHPEAKRDDQQFYEVEADSVVLEEDLTSLSLRKQKSIKAKELYVDLFGSKADVVDFSGREIKFDAYGDEKSKFGWKYVLYDEKKEENSENVLIANIKSLADFKRDTSFITNGHSFVMTEIDGKNCITSRDFVTDPYNFSQALQVSENQIKQKGHLIYIFIRLIGASLSIVDKNNVYKFVDIIDKTAKKCCPKSFIDMNINMDDSMDYISIIFDGENDEAYKEATEYAILVNSYRRNFYDLNMLNAIIILDEIEVPYTLRHITFKELINRIDDQGLVVIKYDLMHKIINSTIKRTIHVGKQIKEKIGEYQNSLRNSTLAKGEFAEVYHNHYSYDELNLIYNLRRRAENSN